MGVPQSLLWKVWVGVIGGVSTLVAQKAVTAAWKASTGDEPPSPSDPRVPLSEALIWALASGVGVATVQLLSHRFAARSFVNGLQGVDVPKPPTVTLKV